jgi:hypothetical protein
LYVIDISKEVKSVYGGLVLNKAKKNNLFNNSAMTSIDYARRHIHQTMAEEEMRNVHTLAIVLNLWGVGKLQSDLDREDGGDNEETI